MPDTSEPEPKESEPTHEAQNPTPLADEEYHEHADAFLEQVVNKMEEIQEGRDDVDVEFAVCVSLPSDAAIGSGHRSQSLACGSIDVVPALPLSECCDSRAVADMTTVRRPFSDISTQWHVRP